MGKIFIHCSDRGIGSNMPAKEPTKLLLIIHHKRSNGNLFNSGYSRRPPNSKSTYLDKVH